tara:strand:- start:198 stop:956 length:759 start_codon:yes stop_codon:yes gene_type:complete
MYTINIKHKDKGLTTYTVYKKEEADEKGIAYKKWQDADKGEYGISDDEYVAKVISRRIYKTSNGRKNVYLRFPWGYTFYNPKGNTKPLKVKGRKANNTMSGKRYIEVQAKQDKMKNLATMFAIKPDYDIAIEWALGEVESWEKKKWKRTMKTEVFKGMVREELVKLLTEHGMTEDYTLNLLEETIQLAKSKKDVTNLMRGIENLQDMHGMKEKHLVKTTDKLEAHSSAELIDDIVKEEKTLLAQRTTESSKE